MDRIRSAWGKVENWAYPLLAVAAIAGGILLADAVILRGQPPPPPAHLAAIWPWMQIKTQGRANTQRDRQGADHGKSIGR